MRVVDKVAFLVQGPTVYAHYVSVWAEMDPKKFAVIFHYKFVSELVEERPDAVRVLDEIVQNGYEYHFFDDLRRDSVKFRYVVSNHRVSGRSIAPSSPAIRVWATLANVARKFVNCANTLVNRPEKYEIRYNPSTQYAPLQVGLSQIRFMYGADIGDGWSLQNWNEIYDLFLCHGPNDEAQLKKRFRGKTVVMGYPRYDRYFRSDIDFKSTIREFGIVQDRKTILWMPTLGDNACSIPLFAGAISGLSGRYNVIVRPHPLSFQREPEKVDILRSLSLVIDDKATRDMNVLFKIADFVLCDYGGSSFGAIYLDKNLILLDVPGAEEQHTVVNSSNLEIRRDFPVLRHQEAGDTRVVVRGRRFMGATG